MHVLSSIIFYICVCVHFSMTKPKLRPCPSCQAPQQANRKTCSSCFAALPSKRLEAAGKINDDWVQGVIKNKNESRVVASAQMAVSKNAHATWIKWYIDPQWFFFNYFILFSVESIYTDKQGKTVDCEKYGRSTRDVTHWFAESHLKVHDGQFKSAILSLCGACKGLYLPYLEERW